MYYKTIGCVLIGAYAYLIYRSYKYCDILNELELEEYEEKYNKN